MLERDGLTSDEVSAEFLELFLLNERRLRAFTRALITNREESQDVFQQALLTMLEKFPERDHRGDFVDWAFRVISFKALEWTKRKRRSRLRFDEQILQSVASDAIAVDRSWSARSAALMQCLRGLSSEDRGLLARRYEDGESIAHIAGTTGLTEHTVYRRLSRLRKRLLECINRRLARIEELS